MNKSPMGHLVTFEWNGILRLENFVHSLLILLLFFIEDHLDCFSFQL